jgi:hypothetical protein
VNVNALEAQYRDALRWYPKRWRVKNEDAMVGTLLDTADGESREDPATGELRSLRLSSLVYRAGLAGRAVPEAARDRAAAISLGLGASMGSAGLALNLIVPPRVEAIVAKAGELRWLPHLFGPFGGDAVILYTLWAVAGLLGMTGLRRSARAAVALTIPTAIVIRAISDQMQQLMPASSTTLGSMELLALVVLLGFAGRDRAGRITVLATFLAATAVTAVTAVAGFRTSFYSWGYTTDGFTQIDEYWLAFAAPIALLAAAALAQTRLRAWAGAIVLTLIPIAVTFLFAGSDGPNLLNKALIAAAGGVLIVGVWMLLRRLGYQVTITRSPRHAPTP